MEAQHGRVERRGCCLQPQIIHQTSGPWAGGRERRKERELIDNQQASEEEKRAVQALALGRYCGSITTVVL